MFADLPGYGYARVPKEMSGQWGSFIEPYLKERRSLALCLALVDINVPQQDSDRQLLEFLESAARLFLVVGTKADKLSGNALRQSLDAFRDVAPEVRVVPFSARTGLGRDALWQEIRAACQGEDNLPRQAAL